MILIIGSEDEHHSNYIYQKIQKRGLEVEFLDNRKLTSSTSYAWNASDSWSSGYFSINSRKVLFNDFKSVYWRWRHNPEIRFNSREKDANYKFQMQQREIESAINSIYASLDNCLWVNSLEAIEMHKKKGYQLNLMAKNNIRVPKTLITNDKEQLKEFYDNNAKNIIYKPVRGGAHTQKVTDNDLTAERLTTLIECPVQFQECVEGVDIRVYAVKDEIFAAEIRANSLDFREDINAKIVPVELPDSVKEQCFQVLKLMKLEYSGIDIRKSIDGEYVFIEANPAPMFIHFENMTKYPISDRLVDLLVD